MRSGRTVWTLATIFLLIGGPLLASSASAEGGDRRGGGRFGTQVVGGQDVPNAAYPFVATLLDLRRGRTTPQRLFCGGSLIDASHVLTAAHCVTPRPRLGNLRVVVGRTVLSSTQGQTRRAAAITVHPNWNPSTSANDAAVLRLSAPITGIAPIAPATEADDAREEPPTGLTIAGWGNVRRQSPDQREPDRFPDRMREAQVSVVTDATCDRQYANGYGGIDAPVMLCAGQPGKDTCQGDSGGPLFAARTGGSFVQVGIVSWGAGCGDRFPGVYTEVNAPAIAEFINISVAPG